MFYFFQTRMKTSVVSFVWFKWVSSGLYLFNYDSILKQKVYKNLFLVKKTRKFDIKSCYHDTLYKLKTPSKTFYPFTNLQFYETILVILTKYIYPILTNNKIFIVFSVDFMFSCSRVPHYHLPYFVFVVSLLMGFSRRRGYCFVNNNLLTMQTLIS